MAEKCPICNQNAMLKCSKCYNVYYCNKEHQKADWKSHKHICKPIQIKDNKKLGRHLVTSKDIKDGHIIFKEKPLIIGPAQVTPPVCLGCMKSITEKDSRPCQKCGWPVCNETCQNSLHHKPECDLTVARGSKIHINQFGIPHPNYQCLIVLRCLYQKEYRPDIWQKLMSLESHCEQRKGSVKWQNDKIQVSEFIKRFFKLENKFTDEEIMRVCGIVQVNGHEVPLTDSPYVAIYDTTSMLEHNCRANCNKSFSSHGEVLIIAASDISTGENLSICYTDPLWGTMNRRHHLEETKFFNCNCARCSDATEMGTMFSALRCQKEHCNGSVLPKSFVSQDTLGNHLEKKRDKNNSQNGANLSQNNHEHNLSEGTKKLTLNDSKISNGNGQTGNINNNKDKHQDKDDEWSTEWCCNKCDFNMNEHKVMKLIEHVGRDLDAMEKGNCESCLRFLQHYARYLHHNHYYMFDVEMAMAHFIGKEEEGSLPAITDERLELKISTCRKLIKILETLVPAEVRARGSLLFELHAGIAEAGRRRTARTGEGPAIMIEHLLESRKLLYKSMHLLQYEPEELPEGKIYKQAKKNLQDMETMLVSLHALELPIS